MKTVAQVKEGLKTQINAKTERVKDKYGKFATVWRLRKSWTAWTAIIVATVILGGGWFGMVKPILTQNNAISAQLTISQVQIERLARELEGAKAQLAAQNRGVLQTGKVYAASAAEGIWNGLSWVGGSLKKGAEAVKEATWDKYDVEFPLKKVK